MEAISPTEPGPQPAKGAMKQPDHVGAPEGAAWQVSIGLAAMRRMAQLMNDNLMCLTEDEKAECCADLAAGIEVYARLLELPMDRVNDFVADRWSHDCRRKTP
ncbi:MAG: hypothetical protein OXH76_13180 [Boseongicola sp.]|nr:hypothetical protein [Boseongicola sp.]